LDSTVQRWNDDRLDDLARRVDEHGDHLKALTEIMVQQAELKQKLSDLAEDTSSCLSSLQEITREWRQREQAQRDREETQRKERKADRRWLVGTAILVCSIIIAALGVFLH